MVSLDDKRREWLENLNELRKKKENEFKELEEKKKRELKEAEEMLKAGVEELTAEELQILENLRRDIPELEEVSEETAKKEEPIEEESLEETLTRTNIPEEAKQQTGPIYGGGPIEETIAATQAVYQRSDYNVYNDLRNTFEKVQRGEYLTQEERTAFYRRQEEFNKMSVDNEIVNEKDSFGYIERSKQVIESIDRTLHSQSQYKTGDDHI